MADERGGRRRARQAGWLPALLAATLVVAVPGCASGGITAGTALSLSGREDMGVRALPPGAKIGILNLVSYNQSNGPLTITKITITGQGLGTVARVTEVKIAPVSYGPGGLYVTNPPVINFPHAGRLGPAGCHVQKLVPPRGYVMPPSHPGGRGGIFIWAVVQMIRPGRYNSLGSTVYYTQNGNRYRDFVTIGFDGSVASHAAWPLPYLELGCLGRSRLLNPGHR